MRYPELPGGEQGQSPIHLKAEAGSGSIEIPNGDFLLGAEFTRVGSDLLLEGKGGPPVLVEGYFVEFGDRPMLVTADGAKVWPELAEALSGPLAPAQIAQAGGAGGGAQIGTVSQLTGDAHVIRTSGAEESLRLDDPVYRGDVLLTDPGESVGLTFADKTMFSLAGEGRLVLDEMVYNPAGTGNSLSMTVLEGVFAFVTGEVAGADGPGMMVKTPVASIGVRGTSVVGGVATGNPDLPPFFSTLIEDLITEAVGTIDVFNESSLITLAEALATAILSGGTIVFGEFTAAMQAAVAQALVSLQISIAHLLEQFDPGAGPESIPGGGDDTGFDLAPNQFFDPSRAHEFGEAFGRDPSGLPIQLLAVLDRVNHLLDDLDPNLLETIQNNQNQAGGGAQPAGEGDREVVDGGMGTGLEEANAIGMPSGPVFFDFMPDGPVVLTGLPQNAQIVDANGVPLFFSNGPGEVIPLTQAQATGFGIVPPQFDDSDFTFVATPAGPGPQTEFTVVVQAIADQANAGVNDIPGVGGGAAGGVVPALNPAVITEVVVRNPLLSEREGQGNIGANDTRDRAIELGSFGEPAPSTVDPLPAALTVNGWITDGIAAGNGDFVNDIDVYSFVIEPEAASSQTDALYSIDINFGDVDEGDGAFESGGRIEAFDSVLWLFDENGDLIASNNDSQRAGDNTLDPLLEALGLEAGTYYVVVTAFDSSLTGTGDEDAILGMPGDDDFSSIFGPGGAFESTLGDVSLLGGDYELQVRPRNGEGDARVRPGATVALTFEEDLFAPGAQDPVESLLFSVQDTDGSESITWIEIHLDPEDLPPGLTIDLAGDGNFVQPGTNDAVPIELMVQVRLFGDTDFVSRPAELTADLQNGQFVLTFPESLQVLEVDLSGMVWTAPEHDDTDFDIEFMVRSTETHPSDGATGADTSGMERGDLDQVGVPHSYEVVTLEIDNQAVADEADIALDAQHAVTQFSEDNSVNMMDGLPRFLTGFDVDVTDDDGSERITEVKLTFSGLETMFTPVFVGQVLTGNTGDNGEILGELTVSLQTDDGPVDVTVADPALNNGMVILTIPDSAQVQHLDLEEFGLIFVDNQGAPVAHLDDDFSVNVMVTTAEGEGEFGLGGEGPAVPGSETAVASMDFDYEVQAVADGADLDGTADSQGTTDGPPIMLSLAAALIDMDDSEEITSIQIRLPANFDTDGHQIAINGTAQVLSQDQDGLFLTVASEDLLDDITLIPAAGFAGEIMASLEVTTTDTDGDTGAIDTKTVAQDFTVTVAAPGGLMAENINMIVTVDNTDGTATGPGTLDEPVNSPDYLGFVRTTGAAGALTFTINPAPTHDDGGDIVGDDIVDPDGTFVYVPRDADGTAPPVPETTFTYTADDGVGTDTGTVTITARDELDLGSYNGGVSDIFSDGGKEFETMGTAGIDIIYTNPDTPSELDFAGGASSVVQVVHGLGGNDYLVGADGAVEVESFVGAGDDLFGGEGDDWLFGLGGVDRLSGDDGEDMLFGDISGDAIVADGTNGTDGGPAGDGVDGGDNGTPGADGDDGTSGEGFFFDNDQLFGGDNDDVLYGDVGGTMVAGAGGSGGAGGDGGNGGNGLSPFNNGGNGGTGGNGGDGGLGRGINSGSDTLDGGMGNDTLFGDSAGDMIGGVGGDGGNGGAEGNGGNGADGPDGGDGGRGGQGRDGQEGKDGGRIRGGGDHLIGGEGDDVIYGDAMGNMLAGDGGNGGDRGAAGMPGQPGMGAGAGDEGSAGTGALFRGDGGRGGFGGNVSGGFDTLEGGEGNDTLFGDAGGDLGGGTDGEDGDNNIGSNGIGGSGGVAVAGDDTLMGGDGEDLLVGDAGGDLRVSPNTMPGFDELFGGMDNDTIFGDAMGNDNGLGGDDLIYGDQGADTLTGNGGADTFAYNAGDGGNSIATADVITDFEDTIDLIGLDGTLAGARPGVGNGLLVSDDGEGNAVITVEGSGEVLAVLEGIAPGQITSDDFMDLP